MSKNRLVLTLPLLFVSVVMLGAGFWAGHLHNSSQLSATEPASGALLASGIAARDAVTRGVIRCGYIAYPPFFTKDPVTGAVSGIMADLVTLAAQKSHLRVEWTEETGWGTMIEGLKSGRFDAMCSGAWKNASRAAHVDFSSPIGYSPVYAWIRADDRRFDQSLDRINQEDIRISVMDGEMNDHIATHRFPKAQRISLPQSAPFSDLLLNVTTGKADVVFAEPEAVADFIKANPGQLVRTTLDRTVALFPITVPVDPMQPRLQRILNTAIEEMKMTGMIEPLLARYNVTKDNLILDPVPASGAQ